MEFEANYLRDETHILKWSTVNNCEDQKLILAVNKMQEKSVILIEEQIKPSAKENDNLGNLIEGIQRYEKMQREEYESQRESNARWYP